MRYAWDMSEIVFGVRAFDIPLIAIIILGGLPLVLGLVRKIATGEFGADLLAGLSIITAVLLDEYLAGALVVLMLSGGEALEGYAVRSASSVLRALADRLPSVAHIKSGSTTTDVELETVRVGDVLLILPHETCPVDGTVIDGHGTMDESYLTGEPFLMSKTPGSTVLSGAINGESALTITATRRAVDSRYARIMEVMRESEQRKPKFRRLGDQLGAWYTPLALAVAILAWIASGNPTRFLAVLVVATPCPLLIAIPVSIIGSISLAAKHGIIVRDPGSLEKLSTCKTAIFDKTGTLTYGRPQLIEIHHLNTRTEDELIQLVGSLERYSKHPLADAIVREMETRDLTQLHVESINEPPGKGLMGTVDGRSIIVTNRKMLRANHPHLADNLPPGSTGLECVVLIDNQYGGLFRFRDQPRRDGHSFVQHLKPRHDIRRMMIISGDKESEVKALAETVGITEIHSSQSPEQKLGLVEQATELDNTVYLGDGINDAPALTAATVGIAFGKQSDVTSEAADMVIMDTSLEKVDQVMHISSRMRSIALQSAIGGMSLSVVGMGFAAFGFLPPVAGAIAQEAIDVVAVVNSLRAVFPPKQLTDY